MFDVIAENLAPGIAAAISVVPILAVVVTLTSTGGRSKAVAVVACWIVTLVALTTVLTVIGSGWTVNDASEPTSSGGYVKAGLGVIMVVLAMQQWRSRPRAGESARTPGWLAALDDMSSVKAGALGVALAAANVKNLPIVIGVALTIAQADLSSGSALVAAIVFALVASLGVLTPIVVSVAFGEQRAGDLLGEMRRFLTDHNNVIMAVIFLLLGVSFLGDGLTVVG